MTKGTSPPPRRPLVHKPPAVQSHEIRIIGGQWKRTKLQVADKPGLRPTPDRVRETLFNWLGQDLTGMSCLDVFAGTGALGFEAASRGAERVQLVEQDSALVSQLYRVQQQLGAHTLQISRGDGLMTLRQASPQSWDVIFLDPPFEAPVFEHAIKGAAAAVSQAGQIYLEAPIRWTDEALQTFGLSVHRHLKAGKVHAHLLRRAVPGAAMQVDNSSAETTPDLHHGQ